MKNATVVVLIIVVVIGAIIVYQLGKSSSSGDAAIKVGFTPSTTTSQRQHPVLEYQREASLDTHPANYGDPICPPPGGISSGPAPSGNFERVYGPNYPGPAPGAYMGVPVPQASLKLTSEQYGYPFHYQNKPLHPYDYFKPYGPNQPSLQNEIVVADTPFYNRSPLEGYVKPGLAPPGSFGETPGIGEFGPSIPFISSVNAFAPFPEVNTPWEKTGIIQTVDPTDDSIMNLYRKPIAPLQDLFEYSVQDKNGFVVPLKGTTYLEDGDIVKSVPGRESKGPWKADVYINNKWVWV